MKQYGWHVIALLYLVVGSFFAWEYLQSNHFVHVGSANTTWRSIYQSMDTRTGVVCDGGPKLKIESNTATNSGNPLDALKQPESNDALERFENNPKPLRSKLEAVAASSPYEEEKYCSDLK